MLFSILAVPYSSRAFEFACCMHFANFGGCFFLFNVVFVSVHYPLAFAALVFVQCFCQRRPRFNPDFAPPLFSACARWFFTMGALKGSVGLLMFVPVLVCVCVCVHVCPFDAFVCESCALLVVYSPGRILAVRCGSHHHRIVVPWRLSRCCMKRWFVFLSCVSSPLWFSSRGWWRSIFLLEGNFCKRFTGSGRNWVDGLLSVPRAQQRKAAYLWGVQSGPRFCAFGSTL